MSRDALVNIVLLTTETTHHTYYAWKLVERFPLQAIIVESRQATPSFETFHPFEQERDAYERETLLAGCRSTLRDVAPAHIVDSGNDAEGVTLLTRLKPEVLLVFGAGKLLPPAIRAASVACLNLHGGNPECYRGLDSHLWAIYHDDFGQLLTTLHVVDDGLDTGDIVQQTRLPLARGCRLHQLRAINTQACLELSLSALETLRSTGTLPTRQQTRRGTYYSFMPSALKETCVQKFAAHMNGR